MANLKLFHGPVLIGTISNITPEDMFEMSGDIQLTPEFERYKPIFSFLLSNDGLTDGSDPPFEESYFDNWLLEDESGKQQPIDIPSIEDGEVMWRDLF
jgi:hypothetical protein